MRHDEVQYIVNNLSKNWKNIPPINVVDSMQDSNIPQHLRDYDAQLCCPINSKVCDIKGLLLRSL